MPLTVYEQPFLTIAAAAKLVKPRIALSRQGAHHCQSVEWGKRATLVCGPLWLSLELVYAAASFVRPCQYHDPPKQLSRLSPQPKNATKPSRATRCVRRRSGDHVPFSRTCR
jgi:hypothetical protein